jgi:hypothetical protein
VFSLAGELPWMLQGPFRATAYPAGFPLFPWAGFFFLGAGLGFLSARRNWKPAQWVGGLAVVSVLALGVAAWTEAVCTTWLGSAYAFVGPSLVLRRLGVAAGLLAVVGLATKRLRGLPDSVLIPSRYSLTFYVAHMAVIWGTPWFIGLHHAVGASLTWAGCAAVAGVVLAVEWIAVRSAQVGDGLLRGWVAEARDRWRAARPATKTGVEGLGAEVDAAAMD